MQLCIHQEILKSIAPVNEISHISLNGQGVCYIFNAIYMHIFLPLFPLVFLTLVPNPLWWVSIWIKVIMSRWKKECFLWKEVEVLSVKKLLFLTVSRHLWESSAKGMANNACFVPLVYRKYNSVSIYFNISLWATLQWLIRKKSNMF